MKITNRYNLLLEPERHFNDFSRRCSVEIVSSDTANSKKPYVQLSALYSIEKKRMDANESLRFF